MTALLSPSAKLQFFDDDGTPLAGGKLYTYLTGTSTAQAVYQDRTGAVPHANPVILDSRGEAAIYLEPGVVYRWTLKTAEGVTVNGYPRDGVSASAGETDSVHYTADETGASTRTLTERLGDSLSVKDFGAVGDGVTDDAPAFLAAITAAAGREIRVPAGLYLCGSNLTASGSLSLRGDGAGQTEIRFTSSTSTEQGIALTLTSDSTDYFSVRGLTLSTSTGFVSGKHALQINGAAQISGSYIANRSYRRGVIEDVVARGIDTATGWDFGLRLTSVTAFHVNNYTYWGDDSEGSTTGDWQGEAIRIDGAGVPVEMKLTNLWVYSAYYAVRCPDYVEGLYVAHFDFVNVRYGVVAQYASGVSVVAEASCGILQPTIGPGHIKSYLGGVVAKNINQAFLGQLNIYVTSQPAYTSYSGIALTTGANNFLSDISITDTGTSTNSSWGVVFDNIDRSFVTRVSAYSFKDSCIYLKNDSDDNIVTNCLAYDCINIAIADSTSGSNWFVKNKGMSITGSAYGGTTTTNNYVENRAYSVSVTPTLTGGATSENVNVGIPSGVFTAKPSVIVASAESDSQNLICAPIQTSASTTATNAVIKVFRNDGASIAGGSVRLHVVAYE